MDYKVDISRKCLDLWLVASLDAVFNGERMEMKYIKKQPFGLFDQFRTLAEQIDPDNGILFGQQPREVCRQESFLHLVRIGSVDKYLHKESVRDYTKNSVINNRRAT